MRYLKYLLFMLIIPFNIYAMEMYCDRNITTTKEFKCIISNSSNSLYSLNAKLDIDEDFEIVNIYYSKGYTGSYKDKTLSISGPGYNAPTTVMVLTLKAPKTNANKNYKITLSDIKYKFLETEVNERVMDNSLISNITVKGNENIDISEVLTLTLVYNSDNSSYINYTCDLEKNNCGFNLNDYDIPKKGGYNFTGWSESESCDKFVSGVYNITKNTNLYACYEKIVQSEFFIEKFYIEEISDFAFDENTYTYYVSIPIEKTSINFVVDGDGLDVKVSKSASNLQTGLNIVEVTVSKGDIVRTYEFYVSRFDDKVYPKLSALVIKGYDIEFTGDSHLYNLYTKDKVRKLDIEAIPEKDEYKVEILNNENLKDKSKVIVRVIDLDNNQSDYEIIVNYPEKYNKTSYLVYGVSFVLFCVLVYVVMKLSRNKSYEKFMNKLRKDKDSKKKEEKNKENIEKL